MIRAKPAPPSASVGHNSQRAEIGGGITRAGLADEIDALDESIAALNASKSDAYKTYKEQLEGEGMTAQRASAEVAALKAAIVRRRKLKADPEAVRERDGLIDEILDEISRPTRAHAIARAVPTDKPAPHLQGVDGGQPHPSSDDAGAKNDGPHPIAGQASLEEGVQDSKSEHQDDSNPQDRNEPVSGAGSTANQFEEADIPGFLKRNRDGSFKEPVQ